MRLIDFIPKSGVAFILLSVVIFFIWAKDQDAPFSWIISAELILFAVCFILAEIESPKK